VTRCEDTIQYLCYKEEQKRLSYGFSSFRMSHVDQMDSFRDIKKARNEST